MSMYLMYDYDFMNENIYVSLEEAKEEIWRRWNDKELRKKVEDFLGGDIPEPFKKEPRAVITRQLLTPNMETIYFFERAKMSGLKILSWEFLDDLFTTTNECKAYLAKVVIFKKDLDKNLNLVVVSHKNIIDLTGVNENKKFNEIKTVSGENFVDFHHKLLKLFLQESGSNAELYDASYWYRAKKEHANRYYKYLLTFFIAHGILFENFDTYGDEKNFTEDVFIPAFKEVLDYFGVKPLIVTILPEDLVESNHWLYYSDAFAFIKQQRNAI